MYYIWLGTVIWIQSSTFSPNRIFPSKFSFPYISSQSESGGGNVMCVCRYQKFVCKEYRTEGVYFRYIQYIRISVIVQSRRVQLFLVNCLLINKFNIPVMYYLYIFKSTLKAKFSCKEYNLIKVYNKLLVIQIYY